MTDAVSLLRAALGALADGRSLPEAEAYDALVALTSADVPPALAGGLLAGLIQWSLLGLGAGEARAEEPPQALQAAGHLAKFLGWDHKFEGPLLPERFGIGCLQEEINFPGT